MQIPGFLLSKVENVPESVRNTLFLRGFGLAKIPLIFLISPKVVSIDENQCQLKVPLNRITKNHVGSLYFGALSIAADATAGALALYLARKEKIDINFIFKSFKAEFLKRCEGETLFECKDGGLILEKLRETQETKERINFKVNINVFVPEKMGQEVVAQMELEFSIKSKN